MSKKIVIVRIEKCILSHEDFKVVHKKEFSTIDKDFLIWFKDQTERKWMSYDEVDLNNLKSSTKSYCNFQKGTKWHQRLTEKEIIQTEKKWNVMFPPDYRLFLELLHTVDKPQLCIGFNGNYYYETAFYNWKEGIIGIEKAYQNLLDGLVFDVEHNHLWVDSWGNKPEISEKRKEKVTELLAQAPKLIPIIGHRFLLAEPCTGNNPVFSIVQSDIIVYGNNLRNFLIHEFLPAGTKSSVDRFDETYDEIENDQEMEKFRQYKKIPFWGELL